MSKKKARVAKPARTADSRPRNTTKLAHLEAMLRRPDGATIEQIGKALGWQPHSVRGAIAGVLKKKGCVVTSEVDEIKRRIYRIAQAMTKADMTLEAELAQLDSLGLAELRSQWAERLGKPPLIASTEVTRRWLAWELQAKKLGGFEIATRRRLRQLSPSLKTSL